jgi:hypothetical protein
MCLPIIGSNSGFEVQDGEVLWGSIHAGSCSEKYSQLNNWANLGEWDPELEGHKVTQS